MRLPLSVRVEDDISAANLEADAWAEVETLEIYRGKINARMHPAVRKSEPADDFACIELAGRAFAHDRLHKDPTVSNEDADEFKRASIRECFDDPKNVRVYELGGIRGFLAMNNNRIVLIAVDPEHRKQGIAKALLGSWHGRIEAGTQSDNEPAKKLYESFSMEKVKSLRTFHKWP